MLEKALADENRFILSGFGRFFGDYIFQPLVLSVDSGMFCRK